MTPTTPQGHCNGTFYQRDSGNPKCGKCGALPNEKCAETKTTTGSKIMVIRKIVPDDGLDGVFWRDGQRYLREHGLEYRLIDLAPNLEAKAHMEELLKDDLVKQIVEEQCPKKQ